MAQIQAEDQLKSLRRRCNICSLLRSWVGFEKTGESLKVTDLCEKIHKKIFLTMTGNSILQGTPRFLKLHVKTSRLKA